MEPAGVWGSVTISDLRSYEIRSESSLQTIELCFIKEVYQYFNIYELITYIFYIISTTNITVCYMDKQK